MVEEPDGLQSHLRDYRGSLAGPKKVMTAASRTPVPSEALQLTAGEEVGSSSRTDSSEQAPAPLAFKRHLVSLKMTTNNSGPRNPCS